MKVNNKMEKKTFFVFCVCRTTYVGEVGTPSFFLDFNKL